MVQAQGTTCLKNKSHQRDWHPENKGQGLKGQTVQAWWGFSFISSGSQGQSEGSTVRFVFCKKSFWNPLKNGGRARGQDWLRRVRSYCSGAGEG